MQSRQLGEQSYKKYYSMIVSSDISEDVIKELGYMGIGVTVSNDVHEDGVELSVALHNEKHLQSVAQSVISRRKAADSIIEREQNKQRTAPNEGSTHRERMMQFYLAQQALNQTNAARSEGEREI